MREFTPDGEEFCPFGHTGRRASGKCIECDRKRAREYRNKNLEQQRASTAAWIAANRERRREWRRQYRAKNPDKAKTDAKKHRLANPEKARARHLKWRTENADKFRASRAQYRAENMDKILVHCTTRRARKAGAGGTHTADDITAIARAQKNRCAWCKVALAKVGRHVDHIKPLSKGGHNGRSNLQLLCESCNSRKWCFDPVEFAQREGRLL